MVNFFDGLNKLWFWLGINLILKVFVIKIDSLSDKSEYYTPTYVGWVK